MNLILQEYYCPNCTSQLEYIRGPVKISTSRSRKIHRKYIRKEGAFHCKFCGRDYILVTFKRIFIEGEK